MIIKKTAVTNLLHSGDVILSGGDFGDVLFFIVLFGPSDTDIPNVVSNFLVFLTVKGTIPPDRLAPPIIFTPVRSDCVALFAIVVLWYYLKFSALSAGIYSFVTYSLVPFLPGWSIEKGQPAMPDYLWAIITISASLITCPSLTCCLSSTRIATLNLSAFIWFY